MFVLIIYNHKLLIVLIMSIFKKLMSDRENEEQQIINNPVFSRNVLI